jgi:hypothetical protein
LNPAGRYWRFASGAARFMLSSDGHWRIASGALAPCVQSPFYRHFRLLLTNRTGRRILLSRFSILATTCIGIFDSGLGRAFHAAVTDRHRKALRQAPLVVRTRLEDATIHAARKHAAA